MAKFNTCSNGHNYDAGRYKACPYCPSGESDSDYDRALNEFRRTRDLEEVNHDLSGNAIINEDNNDAYTNLSGNQKNTYTGTNLPSDINLLAQFRQSKKRKIVGWLVTFSHDDYGQDYRLFIGKNKIGSAKDCDIIIDDPSVSGDHTTILYRNKEFLIRDDCSANGTRINGKSIKEVTLNEGDEVSLGNTVFRFKTVF